MAKHLDVSTKLYQEIKTIAIPCPYLMISCLKGVKAMSHVQQIEFVKKSKEIFPELFSNKKILEVGSLNINGSIRKYFDNCNYTGIDLAPGLDVDTVIAGQEAAFPSNSFDMTISCNCFEHNPFWLETFINMCRMTAPKGLVLITSAGYGFQEHGTSRTSPEDSPFTTEWDYYRNLGERDFVTKINLSNWFSDWFFVHYKESKDLYFLGIRKSNEPVSSSSLNILKQSYNSDDAYSIFSRKLGILVDKYYIFKRWRKSKLKELKKSIRKKLGK